MQKQTNKPEKQKQTSTTEATGLKIWKNAVRTLRNTWELKVWNTAFHKWVGR